MIALAEDDGAILDCIGDLCLESQAIHQKGTSNYSHDWLRISPCTGIPRLGSSSKVHSVDHKGLCLDILDLTACSFVRPSKVQASIASKFVKAVLAKTAIRGRHERFWTSNDEDVSFQRRKMLLSEIIGCVLYCGLEWISLQISSDQISWKRMVLEASDRRPKDCFFYEEVRDMLIAAEIVDEQKWILLPSSLIKKLHVLFSYLIFCNPLNSNDSPSLSMEHFSRALNNQKMKECLVLELGNKSKALVVLSSYPKEQEILVVPQALNEMSCVSLRRLWYLKKLDDSHPGSWTVTSMYKVLTFRPIKGDDSLIVERKSQRILGESFSDPNDTLTNHASPNSSDGPLVPTSADDALKNLLKSLRTILVRLAKDPDGGRNKLVLLCGLVRQLIKDQQLPNRRGSRLSQEQVGFCIACIVRTVGSIGGYCLDLKTIESAILELKSRGKDFF